MNVFHPSPAFQTFFAAVIAEAITPAGRDVTMPPLTDAREVTFAATILAPLVEGIVILRGIGAPPPLPPSPYAGMTDVEYQMWLAQQGSSGGP